MLQVTSMKRALCFGGFVTCECGAIENLHKKSKKGSRQFRFESFRVGIDLCIPFGMIFYPLKREASRHRSAIPAYTRTYSSKNEICAGDGESSIELCSNR